MACVDETDADTESDDETDEDEDEAGGYETIIMRGHGELRKESILHCDVYCTPDKREFLANAMKLAFRELLLNSESESLCSRE